MRRFDLVADGGAIPDDDAHDSSSALQAALDAARSDAVVIVTAPPGSYVLRTPVEARFGTLAPRLDVSLPGVVFRPRVGPDHDAIALSATAATAAFRFADFTFLGDGGSPPSCRRALYVDGSDYAAHRLERLWCVQVAARESVLAFGTGSALIADGLRFIACSVVEGKRALLDADYVFALTVRDFHAVGAGAFGEIHYTGGWAAAGIRTRRHEVPIGYYRRSQLLVEGGHIDGCDSGIKILNSNGLPNGPFGTLRRDRVRGTGQLLLAGAPTGVLPSTLELRIDVGGSAGKATWSWRHEPAGWGRGWTEWASAGAAVSAMLGTTGIVATLSGGQYAAGDVYLCYVTGMMRFGDVQIRSVGVQLTGVGDTAAFHLAEVDRVHLDGCYASGPVNQDGVQLWDCGSTTIERCCFDNGASKITGRSGYGFLAPRYVRVVDSVCGSIAMPSTTELHVERTNE